MSHRILASDPATLAGWAHSDGHSGVVNLRWHYKDGRGERLKHYRLWLLETEILFPYDIVAVEAPVLVRGRAAPYRCHVGFVSILEELEAEGAFRLLQYTPAEIKKHATGKGNANKDAMIAAAKERWPNVEIEDDNHADALWILSLAEHSLRSE